MVLDYVNPFRHLRKQAKLWHLPEKNEQIRKGAAIICHSLSMCKERWLVKLKGKQAMLREDLGCPEMLFLLKRDAKLSFSSMAVLCAEMAAYAENPTDPKQEVAKTDAEQFSRAMFMLFARQEETADSGEWCESALARAEEMSAAVEGKNLRLSSLIEHRMTRTSLSEKVSKVMTSGERYTKTTAVRRIVDFVIGKE